VCAGDPIVARTPGDAVDGEMERSAANGITFVRPPQLRRRGPLCPGMMVETITVPGRERFDSGYRGSVHLLIAHEQLSHLHRRAERAKPLLANPALSVTDIALDLGFRDNSSFSTTFRKLVGRAPTDYRRSLLPDKA
jgi:hypothetical protein